MVRGMASVAAQTMYVIHPVLNGQLLHPLTSRFRAAEPTPATFNHPAVADQKNHKPLPICTPQLQMDES